LGCTVVTLLAVTIGADEPPVRFEKVPNGGIQPQVLVDAAGTVHLLYFKGQERAGDLFYVRRTQGATAFSEPIRVNSIPGSTCCVGTVFRGRMALGPDGRVHVLWNGSFGYVREQWEAKGKQRTPEEFVFLFYARMEAGTTSFEKQRNLNTKAFGLDGNGSITIGPNGGIHVFWHGLVEGRPDRLVFSRLSTDKGATFSEEERLTDRPLGVCECCTLEAFHSSKGGIYVAYRTAQDAGRYVVVFSSTDGKKFSELKRHPWRIQFCPASTFAFVEGEQSIFAGWETEGDVFVGDLASPRPPLNMSKGRASKYPALAISGRGDRLVAWSSGTS